MKDLHIGDDRGRRSLLKRYLQAWLLSHALTTDDLLRAEIRDALLKTLAADIGDILGGSVDTIAGYLGMRGAQAVSGYLQRGVLKMMDWAGKKG